MAKSTENNPEYAEMATRGWIANDPIDSLLKRWLLDQSHQRLRGLSHESSAIPSQASFCPECLKGLRAMSDTPEIEITPEMIEAGIKALRKLALTEDPYEEILSTIYESMERAKRAPPIPIPKPPSPPATAPGKDIER